MAELRLRFRRLQESQYPTRYAPVRPWGAGLKLRPEDALRGGLHPITDKAPDEKDLYHASARYRRLVNNGRARS